MAVLKLKGSFDTVLYVDYASKLDFADIFCANIAAPALPIALPPLPIIPKL